MLTQCVSRFNKIETFRIPFTRFWSVSISRKIAFGKKIPEWSVNTDQEKPETSGWSATVGLTPAPADGKDGGLSAVVDFQFLENVLYVFFHRFDTDLQ